MGRGEIASLFGVAAAKDLDFGQQGSGGDFSELEAEKAGKAQVGCEGDDARVVGKGAGDNLVEGVIPRRSGRGGLVLKDQPFDRHVGPADLIGAGEQLALPLVVAGQPGLRRKEHDAIHRHGDAEVERDELHAVGATIGPRPVGKTRGERVAIDEPAHDLWGVGIGSAPQPQARMPPDL